MSIVLLYLMQYLVQSVCNNKCNCQVPGFGYFILYFIDFIVHLDFKPFVFLRLIITKKQREMRK